MWLNFVLFQMPVCPGASVWGGGRLTAGQEAQAHDNLTAEKMNLLAVAKLLNMFEDEIQTTEDA